MSDSAGATGAAASLFADLDRRAAALEPFYEDLHRNPELAFRETRTAGLGAQRLEAAGYAVTTGIGGTGVVGVLSNGAGPVVLLRADMDGLPVREDSGLAYASTATGEWNGSQVPVMHACGHDVHVACLIGAAELLADRRDAWSGTVVALLQPAEETGEGARAMLDDGLYDRVPMPDAVLAQHVTPLAAGHLAFCAGAFMAASDQLRITFRGRGGHGSRPEAAVDPVLMAAAFVQRVQAVVSRETTPGERVVVTVGSITAGDTPNVIPEEAVALLNLRSFDPGVRERALASIDRIAAAEAQASGAPHPPQTEHIGSFPVGHNDDDAVEAVNAAFRREFGAEHLHRLDPATGSEDVGHLAEAAGAPMYYWWLGGWEPAEFARLHAAGRAALELPANHSPRFAPLKRPTLDTGVRALVTAALSRLTAER
ncbi:amidohydrolase [Streptomonospora litoralis]|uniref:Putative hydrolase YxeP n=1 Tax=Streptomonospora litoralis TaxID=2498135 RepID=A0A4P6QAC7_9ACTN|nr:amidohydrolase [Streptomonospora litoralis]QBI56681.1 putative hydrolase YxeP [Streptomonospora litoralis]